MGAEVLSLSLPTYSTAIGRKIAVLALGISLLSASCVEALPVADVVAEARCGDGILNAGESCDDGNFSDRDSCTNLCVPAICNDGIHRLDLAEDHSDYEVCDDGNSNENDSCTTLCRSPACHDGIKQIWEACDDGNMDNTDACVDECVRSSCGDGYVEAGVEQCDPAADNGPMICDDQCRIQQCGDGSLDGDEACDDGNDNDGDACTNACRVAVCGDGIWRTDIAAGEPGHEACDGDDRPEDAAWCSVECQIDDHGNTAQTATPIEQDQTLTAHLAPGDEDWFYIIAPISGLYRFEVSAEGGINDGTEPLCQTQKGELTAGPSAPITNGACDLAIEAAAEEIVYFRVQTRGRNDAETLTVRLFPVCGNGRLDENEQCDPTEGLTARFDCRSDCRTRHRAAVGRGALCELHEGGVRCWGSNQHLLLGSQLEGRNPNERGYWLCGSQTYFNRDHLVPTFHLPQWVLSAGSNVRYVGTASDRACAILGNGRMKCWGSSEYLQPQLDGAFDHSCHDPGASLRCEPVPTDLGAQAATIGLSIGTVHQCKIYLESNVSSLRCWGFAANGALGPMSSGDYFTSVSQQVNVEHPDSKNIVYVSLGTSFGCFIDSDEAAYCWGRNDYGSLGIGESQPQNGCTTACERLPQEVQGVGRIVSLSTGDFHTCALNRAGEVWCWGATEFGQTGAPADEVPCDVGGQEKACHRQPKRVEGIDDVIDISTGSEHSCALSRTGTVWCWGSNFYGQLGVGRVDGDTNRTPLWVATLPAAQALSIGAQTSCAHVGESLWCWGLDDMQQITVQQDPPNNNACGAGTIPAPRRLGNLD